MESSFPEAVILCKLATIGDASELEWRTDEKKEVGYSNYEKVLLKEAIV